MCFYVFFSKLYFLTLFTSKISIFMHLIFFQYSIQVALYCSSCLNFIWAQISVSCFKNIWNFFLLLKDIWFFLIIFYAFSLGANKEDLLFVMYYIISLLPIGLNSFILRLLQHARSLYMNTRCLIRFHINMLTLVKRLLKGNRCPCKKYKQKNAFAFSMWKQL